MTISDHGPPVHTRITTLDLARADAPQVLAALTAATQERAPRAEGLVSSTWLHRRPGDDDAARLVHCAQWASEGHGHDAAEALLPLRDVAPLLRSTSVHGYDLHALVGATEGAPLELAHGSSAPTHLITMDARAGRQEPLVDLNTTDTRALFAPCDGFVAAAILEGQDGSRVFEVVQWASPAAFDAVAARPEFAEHTSAVATLVTGSDVGVYDVVAPA